MNSDFPSSVDQAKTYQIEIRGEMDPALLARLQEMGFQISDPAADGATRIEGLVIDQARLRGVLIMLWDLNLEILLVKQLEVKPDEEANPK